MKGTCLLFDLDGTLSDPRVGITSCIRYALEKLGRQPPPDAELLEFIGPPLHGSFAQMLGSQQAASRALAHYRERFGRVGLYENELYAGIQAALHELSGRCEQMYVVTSKPTVYAQKIIHHFALQNFFRCTYGSNLDGTLADKTDLIGWVLRQEDIAAGDAVMIGDRRHDIVGARANHVASIGVLWGYGSKQELVDSGADKLCARPDLLGEALVG